MIDRKRILASILVLTGCLFSLVGSASQVGDVEKISSSLGRIIGGTESKPGEFPFIVSLQSGSFGHFCAGSLIRPGWVLTAAHCVKSSFLTSRLTLVVGLHQQSNPENVERFKPKKIVIHPEYEVQATSDFDFALVQLDGESKFAPISLNSVEIDIPETENDAPLAITAGWGATEMGGDVSDKMMKVPVPLVSAKRCEEAYPKKMTDRMICAGLEDGGKDSCQGDSGGPLLLSNANGENLLIGVVSWGEGCALPKKFGVYSKVNSVNAWVESTVNAI